MIEKPALQPLPASIFPCYQEGQRKVHRDSYVEVDGSYYEVPDEYIGRQVWVRWDARTIRVYNRHFEHVKSFSKRPKGQFSHSLGARGRRTTTMEQDSAWWIRKVSRVGNNCGLWAIEVMSLKGPAGIRVLQGLNALSKKHSGKTIDEACGLALGQSAFRLKDVKRMLERPEKQESFSFMDKHPLIRDMSEYSVFLDMFCPEQPIEEVTQ